MEQQQSKPRVAQPADEEIKKHGDQLARQVRDAAEAPLEKNPGKDEEQARKE